MKTWRVLLCRTGFPLPHRHCMALYLAQTPLSKEKDTLKFLHYQPCQTTFLVQPALMGFGTEEGELAEHQHQQGPRVCDRRARQIVETHQVFTIKYGSHSAGLVSCSGCISTICHIAQINLGPCLLKASWYVSPPIISTWCTWSEMGRTPKCYTLVGMSYLASTGHQKQLGTKRVVAVTWGNTVDSSPIHLTWYLESTF